MNGYEQTRRDVTMPVAPAFTKLKAPVDIMERQAARKAKGGLGTPMLLASMDAIHGKRREKVNGGAA